MKNLITGDLVRVDQVMQEKNQWMVGQLARLVKSGIVTNGEGFSCVVVVFLGKEDHGDYWLRADYVTFVERTNVVPFPRRKRG